MGKPIVYCGACGESIREEDFEKGKAHLLQEQPFCTRCRPLPAGTVAVLPHKPPSTKIPLPPSTPRKTTTAHIPLARPPQTTRRSTKDRESRALLAAGGGVGALALLVLIVAVASSGGRNGPSARKEKAAEPATAPESAPEVSRPPEVRPDPPPERRQPPPPPPPPVLAPGEILRQIESFAASSPDPDAVLLRCEEALASLRGKPEEARAREVETRAREKKKEKDRDRQVNTSIEEARKLRESDPKFERKEEILRLLRAAAEIAGPRRPEVEMLIADYETALRAAEAAAKKAEPVPREAPPPAPPPEVPAIEVVSFALISADTGQPIPEFDPLLDGAILNLARLPTRNLSILAYTRPEKVGAVLFGLDGTPSRNLEKSTPYALLGNIKSKFNPWAPSPGSHTVTATPYVSSDGTGPRGKALAITLTVVDKPAGRPPTVSLRGPPGGAATVPGRVTLAAEASDPDGSVVRVEFFRGATRLGAADAVPYACSWNAVHPGVYDLTARAIDDSGNVTLSAPVRVTLKAGGSLDVSFQDGVAPDSSYAGTQDATISESNPDKILGANKVCEIDGDNKSNGKDDYALLRWDLSSIPPGVRVQSASLTLHLTEKGSSTPYTLYEVKREWAEKEATWNVCARGRAWEAPGAKGPQDRGTEALAELPNHAPGDMTVPLNAAGIALVQSWIDAPATNHGIVIAGPDIKEGSAFASREGAQPAQRPRLAIVLGAGGKLIHYEGFEKGPGKFKGGAAVEGGLNGSRALSVPADGAWIEGLPFAPVRASSLVRFWVRPPANVEQVEVIAWSKKHKTNVRTHVKGLRQGEWNRVEVLLVRMHKEWDGTGPTLEGEVPDNIRVHLADVPPDTRFLLDEFEYVE